MSPRVDRYGESVRLAVVAEEAQITVSYLGRAEAPPERTARWHAAHACHTVTARVAVTLPTSDPHLASGVEVLGEGTSPGWGWPRAERWDVVSGASHREVMAQALALGRAALAPLVEAQRERAASLWRSAEQLAAAEADCWTGPGPAEAPAPPKVRRIRRIRRIRRAEAA